MARLCEAILPLSPPFPFHLSTFNCFWACRLMHKPSGYTLQVRTAVIANPTLWAGVAISFFIGGLRAFHCHPSRDYVQGLGAENGG